MSDKKLSSVTGTFIVDGAGLTLLSSGAMQIGQSPQVQLSPDDNTVWSLERYLATNVLPGASSSLYQETGSLAASTIGDVTVPFSHGLSTSVYCSFNEQAYIPVIPGEKLYLELWAFRANGATGTAGTLYFGLQGYDKSFLPVDGNAGLNTVGYAVGGVTVPTTGVWTKYSGYLTIPTSHTVYNGSDGLGVRYIRPLILVNYIAGTITTQIGSALVRRVSVMRDTADASFNGNVGIGFSSTISSKLQIKTTSNTGLEVDAGVSGDDSRLLSYDRTANLPKTLALDGSTITFKTASAAGGGTTRMQIDSSGNVAIGGTPQSGVPLTISTTNQAGIDIRSSNTSGAYISLVNTNNSTSNIVGNYKAASGGGTFLNQDALLLRSANTIGFAPTSGTVTTFINASGNVLPGADATYDLGGTSLRFNNMYAGSYRFTSTTQFITNGVGTPEGAITASIGSVFLRVDGSTGTVLYVKESGTGNTGWTAMVSSGTISSITNGTSNVSVALNTQVTVTTAGSERVRVDSSGNVGIATNSPNEKLEVAGAGLFTGTAGSQNRNGLLLDRSGTVSRITSGNTSAAAATLEVYTTTSAGTETLAATFSATGDFTAVGNVTAYSDMRLKTDLQVIPNAIDKVQQLTGYTYTRTDTGERQTGLIAQDVMKVLPEVIAEMPSGHLSVAYGNLVGLLVEAIKELTAKVEDLEKRVK